MRGSVSTGVRPGCANADVQPLPLTGEFFFFEITNKSCRVNCHLLTLKRRNTMQLSLQQRPWSPVSGPGWACTSDSLSVGPNPFEHGAIPSFRGVFPHHRALSAACCLLTASCRMLATLARMSLLMRLSTSATGSQNWGVTSTHCCLLRPLEKSLRWLRPRAQWATQQ